MWKKYLQLSLLSFFLFFACSLYAQDSSKSDIGDEQTIVHTGEEPLKAGEDAQKDEGGLALESTTSEAPTYLDFLVAGKYIAFLILSLVGLSLLFGRWINYWVRLVMLAVAFVLFGLDFIYPLHPSPMCGVTKLIMFRFTWGEYFPQFVAMFVAIFLPSLIGRKLFCGWVCPLGALQDLINKIPHKFHYKNFSFKLFNGIRIALFVMFILVFFGVMEHLAWLAKELDVPTTSQLWRAYSAYSIYDPINFFELLHWNLNTTFYILFPILVIASLLLYRPFCYMICPIGLVSWLFEKVAPGRIRIDHSTCNDCTICFRKAPCPTIKPLVMGEKMIPDCTSCGECLHTCPKNSISFGFLPKPSRDMKK